MATIAHSNSRVTGHSLAGRIRGLAVNFLAYRAAARERNRIVRELSSYTDAELGELGFSRYDIRAVAAGTYRR
jgi:uncharacterized protein YjiS (DUF1127 family)